MKETEMNMDPRIGKLNSGKFYCFANGYDKPEIIGTLKEIEIALGKLSNKRQTHVSR